MSKNVNLYEKALRGRDVLCGRFACNHEVMPKRLNVGLREDEVSWANKLLTEINTLWADTEIEMSGTGMEDKIPEKYISNAEIITYAKMGGDCFRLCEQLNKDFGAEYTKRLSSGVAIYLYNSIYNLLRLDLAFGIKDSNFNRTLFGKVRQWLVEGAIRFVVWMVIWGLSGNKTLAKWLVDKDRIAEFFPSVPQTLFRVEDSDGTEYYRGKDTSNILR